MRTRSKLIMLTIAACAGLGSVAVAAPMPLAHSRASPEGGVETVQYYGGGYGYGGGYDGGHRYRAYQGHLRRKYAQEGHGYRAYQGHLRRQERNEYRRAYRYGY